MDTEALIAAIDAAESNALGSNLADLAADRADAIDRYLGRNINPAPEGRSQVVDRTVFEVVESTIPSLVRIFAGTDEVCKALPVGPDDIEAAEQTTAVLNWTVGQRNQWEQIVHDWSKDALLLRNGYCLAWWDDSKRVERERYEGQSDDQAALLLDDPSVKVLQHTQTPDTETDESNAEVYQQQLAQWQQVAAQAQMQGMQPPPQPQAPAPAWLHDLVIERTTDAGRVRLSVLAPEHCLIAADTPDHTLQDCDYFEYWDDKPLSDLRSMGLDIPDDIDSDTWSFDLVDLARDRNVQTQLSSDGVDASMRTVRARMIWIRCALEDDGVARLYYTIRVGNRIVLPPEPCSRIPVASFCPIPMPHRHIGVSYADITADLQDIKQSIKRGALDNLYLANNGRHIVSDQVNLEDMLSSRPGGVVRLLPGARPADGHVTPLVHPFAFDSVIGALNVFNQEQSNRTGISPYFNGTDLTALNRTATGVNTLTQQSAQRVEQIARMFAPAIEYLFSCVLELIQKHANKNLTFQLRGQWFNVDPLAWSTRRDIKIAVGVGAGNKDAMLAQLQQTFAAQTQVGGQVGIATPQNIYQTALEISKLQGFANPERFWNDPQKNPPPPHGPDPKQVQQMMQQFQQMMQQFQQAQEQNRQLQVQLGQEKLAHAQTKLDNKAKDVQMSLANEHMGLREKAVGIQAQGMQMDSRGAQMDMQSQQQDAEDQMDAKLMQALIETLTSMQQQNQAGMHMIAQSIGEAAQAMAAAAQQMGAPKEVIRDQAGRVVGVASKRLQ